jgi:mono/diheme cytochrome c family protein
MFNISIKLLWILLFFSAACGCTEDDPTRNATPKKADSALIPDGMAIFRQKCVTCHGADGQLGLNGAKDLSQSILPLEERINLITHGKKLMTPFGTILSPEEIKAVADYTLTLKK